jgi:small conductance mechanosensitive channel
MATNITNAAASAAAPPNFNPLVLKDKIIDYLILHASALLGGILILVVGILVSRWLAELISRSLERKNLEPPLRTLIVRISRLLMIGLTLIISLETCGFHMTALITGIGVAGVGIGFAMQGLLSNIVAGLTIIFTKPFRVGEYIEIHGVEGVVSQVELVATTLLHGDTSRVVIPNRKIIGEILHNYGTTRQLNLSVGVAYGTDLNKAQALITEMLRCNPRVLRDPAPVIAVSAMGDSAINIAIKPFVKLADFGAAQSELNQAIVERFRAGQIEIPFPQREIRIVNGSGANSLQA